MPDDGAGPRRSAARDARAATPAPPHRCARPADRRAPQRARGCSRARPAAAKAAAGRRAIRDAEREREVLLRVTMANDGPAAAGRPARALPPPVGGDASPRGAGPGSPRPGGRQRQRSTQASCAAPGRCRRRHVVLTSGSPGRGADPVRAGTDRLPPPRPCRERDLGRGSRRRLIGGRVLLRIEDHDRQRCRPAYDAALLEDLAWLGFVADAGAGPPVRCRRAGRLCRGARSVARRSARVRLRLHADDVRRPGRPRITAVVAGPGCPGGCRDRGLDGPVLRVALGRWIRTLDGRSSGPRAADVAPAGDLPIRDRHGNWTYGFAVVVDDLRQGDRPRRPRPRPAAASATQIRLARPARSRRARRPSRITRSSGGRMARKLSKSAGDTGVRELVRPGGRGRGDRSGRCGGRMIDAPRAIEVGRRRPTDPRGGDDRVSDRVSRARSGPPSPRRGRARARRSGARRSAAVHFRPASGDPSDGARRTSSIAARSPRSRPGRPEPAALADADLDGRRPVGLEDMADHLVAVTAAPARTLAQLGRRGRGDPSSRPGRRDDDGQPLGLGGRDGRRS